MRSSWRALKSYVTRYMKAGPDQAHADTEALAASLQSVERKLDGVSRLNRYEMDIRLLEQLARVRREIRYEVERRGRDSANEAKSYADQSIFLLSSSMRAAHKVVSSTEKRTTVIEQALPAILSGAKALEDRIAQIYAYTEKAEADVRAEIEALGGRLAETDMRVEKAEAHACGEIEAFGGRLAETDMRVEEVEAHARAEIKALEDRLAEIDARVVKAEADARAEMDARATKENSASRFEKQVDIDLRNIERDLRQIKGDTVGDMRNVEQRVEFVRSEILYELQAALLKARSIAPESKSPVKAEIRNARKLADAQRDGLRLNVGCGHIQPTGYINVDGRALPGVDIVAEAIAIPVDAGSVTELFSSHLVEHFTRHILERVLLPHWKSLLQPGGSLVTIAPDGAAMLAAVNTGEMSFEDFREVLFGGQDYDGDLHYNLITPDDYCETLERAGFTDVRREHVGKRNGKCFEFKITARR